MNNNKLDHNLRAFMLVLTLVTLALMALLLFFGPVARCQAAAYRNAANGDLLNNLALTPGATLKQDGKATLCDKKFRTGTVRDVTEHTKQKVCAAYGVPKARCTGANYEIDHLISLELGGSNALTNLWPQPYPTARAKDVVEDSLHRMVCAGQISLAAAQKCISTDWTTCPAH